MGEQKVDDNMLMRFIIDANDNGVDDVMDFSNLVADEDAGTYNYKDNYNDKSPSEDDNDKENDSNINDEHGTKEKGNGNGNNDNKSKNDENEVDEKIKVKSQENKMAKGTVIEHYPILLGGIERLNDLYINHTSNTVKFHRMRRCIDRRFDGPKHLRTRDYGFSDDDDFGLAAFEMHMGLGYGWRLF